MVPILSRPYPSYTPFPLPINYRLWAELFEIRPIATGQDAGVDATETAGDAAADAEDDGRGVDGEGRVDDGGGVTRQWVALSRDVVPVNITCISAEDLGNGEFQVNLHTVNAAITVVYMNE